MQILLIDRCSHGKAVAGVSGFLESEAETLGGEEILSDFAIVIKLPKFLVLCEIDSLESVVFGAKLSHAEMVEDVTQRELGIFGKPPYGVVEVDENSGNILHVLMLIKKWAEC